MKDKFLKKIVGWKGYKLIDKDLIKNNRIIGDNSFLDIERILKYLTKNNIIKSLIQIGANDGQRFDALSFFIKKYNTSSLLVEPITTNFKQLNDKYINSSFIKLEHSAISVDNEISFLYKVDEKFLYLYENHIPGITSFNKSHLLTHGVKNKHIVKENVNSISIKDLIKKHDIKFLDLFFVDAEGYDGKIILDFLKIENFSSILIFEYIHIDYLIFDKLINELKKFKYTFFSIDENLICIPDKMKIKIDFF
jgi:FkbM family methyltransferase